MHTAMNTRCCVIKTGTDTCNKGRLKSSGYKKMISPKLILQGVYTYCMKSHDHRSSGHTHVKHEQIVCVFIASYKTV